MRSTLTRRTALLGALGAWAGFAMVRTLGAARGREETYEALVEALVEHGSLPGPTPSGDGLAALYAGALPSRRREIDAVLDALGEIKLARRPNQARVRLLREWAAAGGERRVLAARATALAAAAYGPEDDRRPPVVI